jgi:nucleotide-binding universal stress UspA family protein
MPGSRLFRDILVPTDFSSSSRAILDHVAGLASVFGAKVWLLNVVPSLLDFHGVSEDYFGPFNAEALIRLEEERKRLAVEHLEALERIRKEYLAQVMTEACVKLGGVAESIVDYAGEMKADLIMMPTRGLGPIRRFLIGAVTAKVLHDARCPVWTSPHPRELEPFHPYRRILLAIDPRERHPDLLSLASAVAESFDAQLSVVGALPSCGISGDELARKRNLEIAGELRAQIAGSNVTASVYVMQGDPADIVRQVAEEIEEADLIVIGRGHLQESMGHLRTHAYEIICKAPCPVISL